MLNIIYELYYKWTLVERPWRDCTGGIMKAERAVQGAKISLEAEERTQSKWLRKDGFAWQKLECKECEQ